MLTIATTYLHFKSRPLDIVEMEQIARLNYRLAFNTAVEFYGQHAIEVHASLDEGSLISRTKLLATAGGLFLLIGQYGSFTSGIQTIADQTKYIATTINEKILKNAESSHSDVKDSRIGLGVPGKLKRLFKDVEMGRVSADSAASKAISLLGGQEVILMNENIKADIHKELKTLMPKGNIRIPGVSIPMIPRHPILAEDVDTLPVHKHESARSTKIARKKKGVEIWKSPEDKEIRVKYH